MRKLTFNKHGEVLLDNWTARSTTIDFFLKNERSWNECITNNYGDILQLRETLGIGEIIVPEDTTKEVAESLVKTFIRSGIYWGEYPLVSIQNL